MAQTAFASPPALAPVKARADRMFKVTVCLRPFRAAGPRMEVEQIAGKTVLHHYGHGGSGWSLSWGSAMEALPLLLQTGAKEIAVVGAGAIGMTTAITAQRLGLKVTIYARDRFPDVRSARATGTWSPHSRVAMDGAVNDAFTTKWERMARRTFTVHQSYLGLAGNPVEWVDRYVLSDTPFEKRPKTVIAMPGGGSDTFVDYDDRVKDLTPRNDDLASGAHPFSMPFVRRTSTLRYNVADLYHQLESDFLIAGGRFVPMELTGPADFARIREKAIVNCTGYGARALMKDESIVPVRGQIAWLLPQPEVDYGLQYNHVSVLARRDGILVQALGADEAFGFNDPNEEPDYAAARDSIGVVATMFQPRTAAAAKG
ncbi:FAD-dependent oxidoreductase [Novosphingobium sp. G106]|uniref:FAD-dependent oxidoreductase n=1 Tax=Novosphingobium sp. G106 TaxID=2849500 RepID=UPI0020C54C70|nr:FAD-dependent oxidoreductase [Novosphingobium sp. G106]